MCHFDHITDFEISIFVAAVVSVLVNQEQPLCPPVVAPGSLCERQIGILFYDRNGCKRKVCPSLSTLCNVSNNKCYKFEI